MTLTSERAYFSGGLGNSNEPFLNKPARFPELHKENASRRGKDKELLKILCEFLPKVNDGKIAFSSLCDAVYVAKQISKEKSELKEIVTLRVPSVTEIESILVDIAAASHEGESLVLSIGILLQLYCEKQTNAKAYVHAVNQSGASTKEIGDIDIEFEGAKHLIFELKDKPFTETDVEHAVSKVASSEAENLVIIAGPNGKLADGLGHKEITEKALNKGVSLLFLPYVFAFKMFLILIPEIKSQDLITTAASVITSAKLKNGTVSHYLAVLQKHRLID